MDLTQIRYFLTLARTLNFTRAAEQCNVSQPALTKSIRRLEDELGGPLLLRERSLTQLTALGREVLPMLEQTFQAAERAKTAAAGVRRNDSAPLRIGFATDAPTAPFATVFAELAARLRGFALSLVDCDNGGLCHALMHGTIDVAIATGTDSAPERLNRWPLFTDQPALLVPPGHALGATGGPSLVTLGAACMVGRVAACGTETRMLAAIGAHGGGPARHLAGTADALADLVRAGLGVAVSTLRATRPPGLQAVAVPEMAAHDVVLMAVAGRPHSRAADAFMKLVRARGWELSTP